jgi:hypothetical protein
VGHQTNHTGGPFKLELFLGAVDVFFFKCWATMFKATVTLLLFKVKRNLFLSFGLLFGRPWIVMNGVNDLVLL